MPVLPSDAALRPFLESTFQEFHRRELLPSDPLEFLHRYSDPWDREVVALISSQFAYGNVRQIRASIERWLLIMHEASGGPARFIREGLRSRESRQRAEGFVHRLQRGADVLALLDLLALSWTRHGSLGAHFCRELTSQDDHLGSALVRLLEDWKDWARPGPGESISRSLGHFLASPASGSCCKRWCMLLRWMGRSDDLDPGLWMPGSELLVGLRPGSGLRPRQLILPLDTHVGQISRLLGLTGRKSLDWRAAVEITERLRCIDPEDPIRFDFSLARVGIVSRCRKRFVSEICSTCRLAPACRIARGRVLQREHDIEKKTRGGHGRGRIHRLAPL